MIEGIVVRGQAATEAKAIAEVQLVIDRAKRSINQRADNDPGVST